MKEANLGPIMMTYLSHATRRHCSVNLKAMASPPTKVLVVGGVAGGASCAARLRRLSETAEITIFERGPYVSFANW